MDSVKKRDITLYLARFVTAQKWERLQSVARARTRHVTVILENIRQELNVSAALRTIECLGVQDAYIIDSLHDRIKINHGVAKGSEQWLTVKHYADVQEKAIQDCFTQLKDKGYVIVGTMPHAEELRIGEVPLNRKIALLFGSETDGISSCAQKQVDIFATIPMYGFTQSFNVAASVAMCLYDTITRLKNSAIAWQLSEAEVIDLCYQWLKISVEGADLIEERYARQRGWIN